MKLTPWHRYSKWKSQKVFAVHSAKHSPTPDRIVETCMEKVREEFKNRIPIVRAHFMRGSSVLTESELYIRYVVETAAIEDSIDSRTYWELTERTRDVLLFSGYFCERGQDVLSVLVVSEERLQNEPNDFYLRGGC